MSCPMPPPVCRMPGTNGSARLPTRIGDALILRTTQSYTVHAIGRVSHPGQQDFSLEADVRHESDDMNAVARATALLASGGRIYLVDIDSDAWSTVLG